jgi:UDP-sugar pyrophosphorylase
MDTWLAYAPVKNNPEDAAKVPKGNPYHSATSGEMAIYRANSLILRKAGAQIADPVVDTFNGQEVEVWPRITWSPRWGLIFRNVKEKLRGDSSISQRSALAINGRNIFLEGLSLDGTLIVNSVDEAEVLSTVISETWSTSVSLLSYQWNVLPILQFFIPCVHVCLQVKITGHVQNKGWTIQHVDYKDTSEKEEIRIRGFKFEKVEQLEVNYTEPGKHSLSAWTKHSLDCLIDLTRFQPLEIVHVMIASQILGGH